jgi:acyl carrier protein
MEALKLQIKENIIKYLNFKELTPEMIPDDEPLFGTGTLALDSIDSIELVVMMEREYGVKITDPKEGRKIFSSINAMAEYISAKQNQDLV